MSGVEAAGFVLAVLPLLVHQLSNYAEGFETLRTLTSRKYKLEMRRYADILGTQQTFFHNAVAHLLEDAVEYEEDIVAMIADSGNPLWQDDKIILSIKSRLGRDYDSYVATLGHLSRDLGVLEEKIGGPRKAAILTKNLSAAAFKAEFKDFMGTFKKPIYNAILSDIERANAMLRTLADDALYRESRKTKQKSRRPLLKYKAIRRYAKSLHKALMQRCFECIRHRHAVNLCLEPGLYDLDSLGMGSTAYKFHLTLLSQEGGLLSAASMRKVWKARALEVEPIEVLAVDPTPVPAYDRSLGSQGLRRVAFATTDPVTQVMGRVPSTIPIKDLCSVLAANQGCKDRKCIGYLSDESMKDHQHEMYYITALNQEPHTKTLEDLFSTAMSQRQHWEKTIISHRDCLAMAVTLASIVLQLHGSWLKTHWTSKDIVFSDFALPNEPTSKLPYLLWDVVTEPENSYHAALGAKTVHPLIKSQTLFPLGITLVELALCQPISTLRKPEDSHSDPAVADLTTATRLLQAVSGQEGAKYHDVVVRCLNWLGPADNGLENEKFQQAVFELVVLPLHEVLKTFDAQ